VTRSRYSDEDSPLSRKAFMTVATRGRAEMKSPAENLKPAAMVEVHVATLAFWSSLKVRWNGCEEVKKLKWKLGNVTRLW
jgi:hypothetical protein